MRIELDKINAIALPRDRSLMSREAMDELRDSILRHGLRHPVEVFETEDGYGLISGYRRLMACQEIHEYTENPDYAAIEAVVRSPETRAAALASMVEENEIRESLSPWERSAVVVGTVRQQLFATWDEAIAALYPFASRQKRARLRAIAEVVETFDGSLADPELISQKRLLRIANVLQLGWQDMLHAALADAGEKTLHAQWEVLRPVLDEAEALVIEGRSTRLDRPRRLLRPACGVTVRRERTRQGWILHLTGRGASDRLVESVMQTIEQQLEPWDPSRRDPR